MSDTFLQLSPPNTCGLLYNGSEVEFMSYFVADYNAKIWPGDGKDTLEQFATVDEAAARAREIYPEFNVNVIYGPLSLTSVNVSPSEESSYVGDNLTLNCEYSCGDCTVVYEWLNPGGLAIPGATSSSLTLSNLTENLTGTYTCNVSASNAKGQTGSASITFTVTVYPTIN